jgi:hypothetical protein
MELKIAFVVVGAEAIYTMQELPASKREREVAR